MTGMPVWRQNFLGLRLCMAFDFTIDPREVARVHGADRPWRFAEVS